MSDANDQTGLVLYVDDDQANLVVFETSLSGKFPLLTVSSGAEALELLRTREVAVLLTDQRMPGMSGVELMEHAQKEVPDTVRLLITAYSDVDAAVQSINRGQAHGYLHKPWNATELELTLTQARERYLMAKKLKELERRFSATERLYALGVIAAGVAHEMRSPLTSLMMNLELVRTAVQDPPAERQKGMLMSALGDAEQAVRAITDIVSSIELSTRSHTVSEVDMREVAQLAARSVRGEARRRGRLDIELGSVPYIRGVRTRLGQVVLNLLVNALEALDPARRLQNRVRLALELDGSQVVLTVEDNGPGIEPAVVARIFDPFFTTKAEGGTGLGLAISRQIVTEHQGTIGVESIPGTGTRFVVRLPALPE